MLSYNDFCDLHEALDLQKYADDQAMNKARQEAAAKSGKNHGN